MEKQAERKRKVVDKKKTKRVKKDKVCALQIQGGTVTAKAKDILPKIPSVESQTKNFFKSLGAEAFIATEENRKAFLTAVVAGAIKDKFGLDIGMDTRIKAIGELNKMDGNNVQVIKTDRELTPAELLAKSLMSDEGEDEDEESTSTFTEI